MRLKIILSTVLAATMLGGTIMPAMAGPDKGKKKGSKHYGKQQSKHVNWKRDDKRNRWDRRDDDRWRREAEARRREDEARRRREAQWRNSQNRDNRGNLDRLSDRRQQTKNEWRNIAYLSGGVALLGLIQKDNTLVFAGAAGTLYSLHRYEQDRKSQSQIDRLRASYFSRPYFERDGRRYDRRLVTKNGQKYYQFVRR